MVTVADVASVMEELAPPHLALEGDPIGLQAGSRHKRLSSIMVALDVTRQTVEEADSRGAQMIVAHHPPFYRGLENVMAETVKGALASSLVHTGIAAYAAHTNLDIAPGGVGDCLADTAQMEAERHPLQVTGSEPLLKLVTFVPEKALTRVRKALCRAGAGDIGEYSECTFRTAGTGTFRGSAASRPAVGKAGAFEEVAEWRLETRLPASQRRGVETALRKAHPYEEPAYDIYRLADGLPRGLGRVGVMKRPRTVSALAKHLRRQLKAPGIQIAGQESRMVGRLAVWGGSGAPIDMAGAAGVDCLITGECTYHDAETAQHHELPVIRLGHGASERVVLAPLAERLRRRLKGVKVFLSRDPATPFANL